MPGYRYVYMFHMALFFMASGFMYKAENYSTINRLTAYTFKKIKTIWLIFFIWNSLFSLFHNFFIRINVYTDNPIIYEYLEGNYIHTEKYWTIKEIVINIVKSVFMQGSTEVGGAFWFLQALFVISVGYGICDWIIQKVGTKDSLIIQSVVSLILLALGFGIGLKGLTLYGIPRALSCYSLYHMGRVMRKCNGLFDDKLRNVILWTTSTGLLVAMYFVWGPVSLGSNEYRNPVYLLITSLLGWISTYLICSYISKCDITKKMFIVIGQNTMAIVIFHFLSFKLINILFVCVNKLPVCLVAAFPVATEQGAWWILYTLVGVIVPLGLSLGYKKVIGSIKR